MFSLNIKTHGSTEHEKRRKWSNSCSLLAGKDQIFVTHVCHSMEGGGSNGRFEVGTPICHSFPPPTPAIDANHMRLLMPRMAIHCPICEIGVFTLLYIRAGGWQHVSNIIDLAHQLKSSGQHGAQILQPKSPCTIWRMAVSSTQDHGVSVLPCGIGIPEPGQAAPPFLIQCAANWAGGFVSATQKFGSHHPAPLAKSCQSLL